MKEKKLLEVLLKFLDSNRVQFTLSGQELSQLNKLKAELAEWVATPDTPSTTTLTAEPSNGVSV